MVSRKNKLAIICALISAVGFIFHFTQLRGIPGEMLGNEQLGKIFLYGGIEGLIAYAVGTVAIKIFNTK